MINWLREKFPFLFEEKMPVWLTIAVGFLAAFATYGLAPLYTRQFQVEDVRSSHLTTTTNNLNSEIIVLSQKIRRFNSALANGQNEQAIALREEALDIIIKLQWQLVDLQIILIDQKDERYVTDLSDALLGLQNSLNQPVSEEYPKDIRSSMERLAKATRNVLDQLYGKASLQG